MSGSELIKTLKSSVSNIETSVTQNLKFTNPYPFLKRKMPGLVGALSETGEV